MQGMHTGFKMMWRFLKVVEQGFLKSTCSKQYYSKTLAKRSAHFSHILAQFVCQQALCGYPLKPFPAMDDVDIVEFSIAFRQVDDAFDQSDDPYPP